MPTVAPAFVPTLISFDDDDFGEFEFAAATASTSSSSPPPVIPPPHRASSSQQQWQKPGGDEDDDWGDFVDSPLQPQLFSSPNPPAPAPPSSLFFGPFPGAAPAAPDPASVCPAPPVAADRGWRKPSGALPLSLFGEEDEEDGGGEESPNSTNPQISVLKAGTFASFKSVGSNGVVAAQGEGLKDLIASLYGQVDKVGPATAGNSDGSGDDLKFHSGNGANSDFANGGDDDEDEFNESCWEFKDAVSSTPAADYSDCILVEKEDELAGILGDEAKASDTGSGFQKEGELAGVTGVEVKTTDTDSGFQTSDNYTKSNGQKCENMLGSNLPSRVNGDGEWGSAFVSHDTTVNGFDFQSADNGCNGFASNVCHNFEHANIENGLNTNVVHGDTSLDDSFWEFKDASSKTEHESIGQIGFDERMNLHSSDCSNGNQDFGDSFLTIEGCQYGPNSIVNGSEHGKDCSVVGLNNLVLNLYNDSCNMSAVTSKQSTRSWQDSAVLNEILQGTDNINLKYAGLKMEEIQDKSLCENMNNLDISAELAKFVDFYSRLKQKSCTLVLHHIDNDKADGKEVPDEEPKAVYSDDEIKVAFSKLGIAAFESERIEKCPPNEFTSCELLKLLRNPCFQALDVEYGVSEKIQLAEKDLSSAMWLFEHASYILHILTLASYEEQRSYIISWSKMVSACERELQHGAVIWSQACHANIHKELLSESRGQQYFLALGEIYRIVEIFSASVRLYKAWILLNPEDSRVFLTCIKKSMEAWKDSTLKQALEIISESFGELKVVTAELLESIKFISELSAHILQSHVSNQEAHFCRLSLLPFEVLPDIKQVVWHGDHYFSKLANLWANRISCDAPQLPHIHVGQ